MANKVLAHKFDEKLRTKDVTLDENVSFSSLMLNEKTLEGLTNAGFLKPSPVQLKSIPLGRCGFDLVIKSKSGTGKTLVFAVIALESVNIDKKVPQILILAPTREIAVQIEEVIKCVGSPVEGLKVGSFIGGFPVDEDIKQIKDCHIVVGAPGRIKHLFTLGALNFNSIRLLVFDEADKLLEPSFKDSINEIYNGLPQKKQIIATSATYPHQLDLFLTKYMISPTHITTELETPILLGIKQFVAVLKPLSNIVQVMQCKNDKLLQILSGVSFTQCLIFTNYQTRTESVSNFLNQRGWSSCFISAAQDQSKRLEALHCLKEFKNRILLSTDLTARGIDAPNVDLVINYDIPLETTTYLHRMGRAGRYGSRGICINLAVGNELLQIQHIIFTIDSNLTIAKLSEFTKDFDIWKVDYNSLEQINGTLLPKASKMSKEMIKRDVMNFKQMGEKIKTENKMNETNKLKEEVDDSNTPKTFTQNCESNEVTEILLQSLNSVNIHQKSDEKKRKRQPNEHVSYDDETKRKNEVFCRNTALLNITRLLTDPTIKIDQNLTNSMENHLANIKQEDDLIFEQIEPKIEISPDNENEACIYNLEKVSQAQLEEIFGVSYHCILENKDWKLHYAEEVTKFENRLRSQDEIMSEINDGSVDVVVGDNDLEEPNDLEDEEENYNQIEVSNRQPDPLQWIPVVRQEPESNREVELHENDLSSHFANCYQDCSNSLWNNGLTFESVSDFDKWFYEQWQEQLKSVTNYVQQNIYVQEMSKFQQSRQMQ